MGTRRAITTLWIITKRELSLYFISPIFYLLGASFLLLASLFFVPWLRAFNQGQAPPDMQGTLGNVSIIMLFLACLQLCTRVLIINDGIIIAEDTPGKLSERLQGSKKFLVRTGGRVGSKTVAKEVKNAEHVESVEVTNAGLEVTSASGKDARPAVSSAIINNGWPLLELRPLDLSLEDIFLELTADEEAYDDNHPEEE